VAFDGETFAGVGVGFAVAGVVLAGVGVVWGLGAAPFPLEVVAERVSAGAEGTLLFSVRLVGIFKE